MSTHTVPFSRYLLRQFMLFASVALMCLGAGCSQQKSYDPNSPVIVLSASSLHFSANAGGSPAPLQYVEISNAGLGKFEFQATRTSRWLSINTTGIAPDTMVISAFPLASMTAGLYTDTLVISASKATNSPQKIVVTFTVNEALGIVPTSLYFDMPTSGPVPFPETLTLLSNGGGILHFSATIPESWLLFSVYSGGTPDTIVASIDSTNLRSGTYTQTVSFAAPDAYNSPVAVSCSLRILPWYPQRIFGINNLHGIYFHDSQHGLVVGFIPNAPEPLGIIYGTTDGGVTWNERKTDWGTEIGGLDFIDNAHGCAVGTRGRSYVTSDGGVTWDRVTNDTTLSLWKVKLLTTDTGWAVGPRGLLGKTVNGGRSWTRKVIAGVDSLPLGNLFFQNSATGWIVGNGGLLLYTFDGGGSWVRVHDAEFVGTDLWGITFQGTEGWIVGTSGKVFHTADGGTTWSLQSTPTTERLDVVRFINETTGWIVGDRGTILHTEDRGATWEAQVSGVEDHLFDLFMTSDRRGVAVGESRLVLTTYNSGK